MVVDVEMSDSIEAQKFFVKFLIPNLRPAHYLNWRLSRKSFAFAVKMIKNKARVSLDNVLFPFHRSGVSCFMLLEFMSNLSTSAIAQIRIHFFTRKKAVLLSHLQHCKNLNFNTKILALVCSNSKRNRAQSLD